MRGWYALTNKNLRLIFVIHTLSGPEIKRKDMFSQFKVPFVRLIVASMVLFASVHANQKIQHSPQERYNSAMYAYKHKQWKRLLNECVDFFKNHQDSDFVGDLHYYEGVAYFNLEDYDLANQRFSAYLEKYANEKFFEDVFKYKFEIAKKFESGSKMHMFGLRMMPKIVPAYEETIDLYDEIIKTLPQHELAARSLHSKGSILANNRRFKESIEIFQTLIRRFPKHPLTPDGYLQIAKVYLDQANSSRFTDLDLLDLAEINFRNFYHNFPQDKRVMEAQDILLYLRETYARDLLQVGLFFEKKKQPIAAILYYQKIMQMFPESRSATHVALQFEGLKKDHPTLPEIALLEQLVNDQFPDVNPESENSL